MSTWGCASVLGIGLLNLVLRGALKDPWVLADSYTHLYASSEVRRLRSWPLRLEKFLYDARSPATLDYPPAFACLLALFSESHWPWLVRWLPSVLDTLGLLVASACGLWLGGGSEGAVIIALVWALSPCTHAQTIALSGRPLGALLATLTFSAVAQLMVNPSALAWGLSLLAGALLILSNRLAVQAWVILFAVWTMVAETWIPGAVLGLSLFLAGLLTAGLGYRVHRGHWIHMRRLRRLMPKKRWHQLARVSSSRNVPPAPRGFRLILRVVSFLDLPFVWLALLGWALTRDSSAPVPAPVTAWLLALTVSGALIQAVPPLRFIGEGFRYFEFAIVPLGLVLAGVVRTPSHVAPIALSALTVPLVLLALWQMRRTALASYREGTSRDTRAVALARRMRASPSDRILAVPLQYAPLVTVEGGKATLMMLSEIGADQSEDFYPVMERPPASFAAEFGIQGVFLDRRYAEVHELGLPGLTLAAEEGPFGFFVMESSATDEPTCT